MDTLIFLVRMLDFEEFRISFTFTIFVIFFSFYVVFLKLENINWMNRMKVVLGIYRRDEKMTPSVRFF